MHSSSNFGRCFSTYECESLCNSESRWHGSDMELPVESGLGARRRDYRTSEFTDVHTTPVSDCERNCAVNSVRTERCEK